VRETGGQLPERRQTVSAPRVRLSLFQTAIGACQFLGCGLGFLGFDPARRGQLVR
jgi:hypothetical protein